MKTKLRTLSEHKIAAKWDGMTFMERLELIMEHADLFWSLRLITMSEIAMVDAMHESAKEYIVEREDQPLFTSIDLKKEIAAQHHLDKMQAALQAVFE